MRPIKVLNISSGDLVGSRFNGFDWHTQFEKLGVNSKLLVSWNHHSSQPWVDLISKDLGSGVGRETARLRYQIALANGKEDSNYWWSKDVLTHPFFLEADIVHLQIVQDGTLDLKTLREIFRLKPTVWTWHDPWPMTGHCVYPMDCKRFMAGCGQCPDLQRVFTVAKDHTESNRMKKKKTFGDGYTLHVASNWFENFIESNAEDNYPKPRLLPFGLDLNRFQKSDKQTALNDLGLSPNKITIGVRAVREPQKNFDLFRRALMLIDNPEEIQVVTLQEKGMLSGLNPRIEVRELGWTNSERELQKFFGAIDVFVMPSLFETFGFMALESMASGIPVIGVQETSVDEVCDLSSTGFKISGKSSSELSNILSGLINMKPQLIEKSFLGIERARKNYSLDKFCLEMKNIYMETIEGYSFVKN